MKIIAFPRDANPYQRLLYGAMAELGVGVRYLGVLTPIPLLNVLLLPLELGWHRVRGVRLVHLHWVFGFYFPGGTRFKFVRWLAQRWFGVWLGSCRLLGMKVVWTVHNILPHEPVFDDDVSARRRLIKASELVIGHSDAALVQLRKLGVRPTRSIVIPHGPVALSPGYRALASRSGNPRRAMRFMFIGHVKRYKGLEDLLVAFSLLPSYVQANLTIAGECRDPELLATLTILGRGQEAKVNMSFGYLQDEEISELLAGADMVVLPFRQVTTSGSAQLALCHGKPLVVPRLAGFDELPDAAVFRYEPGVEGLKAALVEATEADERRLAAMAVAAREYAYRLSWPDIAEQTLRAMASLIDKPRVVRDSAV